MAKKKEIGSEIVKYTLRFTEDVFNTVKDEDGNEKKILEHAKGKTVTCGPGAYEAYNSLGVVEIVSTKTK